MLNSSPLNILRRCRIAIFSAAASLFVITTPIISIATIIHVPADRPTVQSGIVSAQAGDTVLIADGIYFERIDFLGKSIMVSSEFALDNDSSHIINTIIDADSSILGLSTRMSACTFENGEDSSAILFGMTIRNGNGRWDPFFQGFLGGGLYIENAKPTIRNCVISENEASFRGGGFYVEKGGDPFFDNCLFYKNYCPEVGGGGYAAPYSAVRILNCEFRENNFHGFVSFAALIDVDSSSFIDNIPNGIRRSGPGDIRNCLFDGNFPWGALEMSNGPGLVDSCVFTRNMSPGLPAADFFNGVYELKNSIFVENETTPIGLVAGILDVSNCLIAENIGSSAGGIVCGANAQINVVQTVIAFNTSPSMGWGAIACKLPSSDTTPDPQISCSNIFGNENGDWAFSVEGQDTLRGNFSLDPRFCDTANGIYSVLSNSPSLAPNNACGLSIGVFDTVCLIPDTTDTTITPDPDTTEDPPLPGQFTLRQNYPNPFNGSTTIEYELPIATDVRVVVYNVLGKKVKVLVNEYQSAGEHSVTWRSDNSDLSNVSSGIYFYSLKSGSRLIARKMIYLK